MKKKTWFLTNTSTWESLSDALVSDMIFSTNKLFKNALIMAKRGRSNNYALSIIEQRGSNKTSNNSFSV